MIASRMVRIHFLEWPYTEEIEQLMRTLFSRLSEKDRRGYAAVEAQKLGWGGREYISQLLGIDSKTICQGLADLKETEDPALGRIRKKGGGRKSIIDATPELEPIFLEVIAEHTAGSPQHDIRWTNLRPKAIAERITTRGISVSRYIACKLLKNKKFVRRQAQKKKSFKQHPDRNPQFENITKLKAKYLAQNQPVISMDTKKKEMIGNFYRAGKLYTRETIEVLDHDFASYGEGKIVPHGFYDIGLNKGHVNIGTSGDTTEFACDSAAHWWETVGKHDYSHATKLLLTCDGGGSNPSNSSLFRQDLQTLANRTMLEIRIAHYPPYCSKHNPIEHLLFPHVTRACEGVVFKSVSLVKELIERTQTSTGLRVTVDILNKVYETGRKATEQLKSTLRIIADSFLPQWNYTVSPESGNELPEVVF